MTEFEAMQETFRRAEQLPANRLLFAEARPLPPPPECVHLHPCPRMLFLLAGREKVCFARAGKIQQELLEPGTLLFAHPGAWVKETPEEKS